MGAASRLTAPARNARRLVIPLLRPPERAGTCMTGLPSRARSAFRADERLHGLTRGAVGCRVGAASPAQGHARVTQTQWLPRVPAHELTFRTLFPEAAAGVLLAGIPAGRPIARAIEPVWGPGVLGDLRVGAGSPEPRHVGSAWLDGGEVVRRALENPDGAIGHRVVADERDETGWIEREVLREADARRAMQA